VKYKYKRKTLQTGRWRIREQGAWAVCECIFYAGEGGQLGCSGFLVINVCNHGEHYETPCIFRHLTVQTETVG